MVRNKRNRVTDRLQETFSARVLNRKREREDKQRIEDEAEEDKLLEAEYREHLYEYRKELTNDERASQDSYDKTLISLSGGAIAISFAFVENFLDEGKAYWFFFLILAWMCWGVSLATTLYSFFFSQQAMEKTLDKIDEFLAYEIEDIQEVFKVAKEGKNTVNVSFLNKAGGLWFLGGIVSLIIFVCCNLEEKGQNGKEATKINQKSPAQINQGGATRTNIQRREDARIAASPTTQEE